LISSASSTWQKIGPRCRAKPRAPSVGVAGHAVLDDLGCYHTGLGQVDHDFAKHRRAMCVQRVPPVAHDQPRWCDPLIAV